MAAAAAGNAVTMTAAAIDAGNAAVADVALAGGEDEGGGANAAIGAGAGAIQGGGGGQKRGFAGAGVGVPIPVCGGSAPRKLPSYNNYDHPAARGCSSK